MGQVTSRRFRSKTNDSSSGDKAFSDNNIARNDHALSANDPWTPFEYSKSSKSVSAGLASISPSESQDHVTAEHSPTLKAINGALDGRVLSGHRSELTIDTRTLRRIHQRKPDQRLTASDVILRKHASGTGSGLKLKRILSSDDSARVSEVLSQTVTFLSYEIDPILIAEFIQRRAAKRNRRDGSGSGSGVGLTPCISDEDVSKVLSRIVSDLNSDEYRSFCDLIRAIGCDGHVLDFLETLDDLLRLMTSAGSDQDTPVKERRTDECTCSLSSDDEGLFFSRPPFAESQLVVDRRFEIQFVYADRESRVAQSFPEVERMKRRKRRRSRLPTADGRTTVIGDTADRYVPMISVRLFDSCLCEGQMRRLSRILETRGCIRDLSIVETRFDTPAKVRLGHSVGQNTGLFQLDLRGSGLGSDGAMYLAIALRTNASVRILNLSRNGINGRGCALLVRALTRNRTVTDLDFGLNAIGDAGCRHLSISIGDNCSLRRLRLSSNSIGSEGAALLFFSLRSNSHLQSLDVSDNVIGDVSVSVLSEALILNRTLRELALDKCDISVSGCRAFARTLKANMKLRSLKVSDNPLGDGGLSALAEGIKFNRSLEELDFNGCGITDSGLLRLLDATRYNATLKTVRLCRNDVTVASRASIALTSSSSCHRVWAWEILETLDVDTGSAIDAFEIYTRLRRANRNLSIVLREKEVTRTVS